MKRETPRRVEAGAASELQKDAETMTATTENVHRDGDRKARRDWLDAVAAEPGVPSGAFRVAYAVEQFINGKTGEAWPSQGTLAERSGMGERAVRKHLETLQRLGWLTVLNGRDRTQPRTARGSHYRISSPGQTGTLVPVRDDEQTGSSVPVSPDVQTGTDELSNRNDRAGKPEQTCRQTGTVVPPNHREPMINMGARPSAHPKDTEERNYSRAPARLGAPSPGASGEEAAAFDDRWELDPFTPTFDQLSSQPANDAPPPTSFHGPAIGDLLDMGNGALLPLTADDLAWQAGDDLADPKQDDAAKIVTWLREHPLVIDEAWHGSGTSAAGTWARVAASATRLDASTARELLKAELDRLTGGPPDSDAAALAAGLDFDQSITAF